MSQQVEFFYSLILFSFTRKLCTERSVVSHLQWTVAFKHPGCRFSFKYVWTKIIPALILARTCEVINASGWLYFFIIKKISAKVQLNLFQSWCVAHFFIIVQINIFNRFLAQSQHILAIICPRKCSLMTAYQYLKFLAHFPVLRLSCMIQSRISQLKIYRKGYGYFMEYFLSTFQLVVDF